MLLQLVIRKIKEKQAIEEKNISLFIIETQPGMVVHAIMTVLRRLRQVWLKHWSACFASTKP
jgi:hypothetical protein